MKSDRVESAAVIGGSGFIGRAISKRLLAEGYKVTVLDIVAPGELPGAEFMPFDIREPESLSFENQAFGSIVIAAGILAKGCNENPDYAWSINVTATLELLKQISTQCPECRVIFISSGMVYSCELADPPFTESAPTMDRCLYTKSKLRVEEALQQEFTRGLRSLILRPFTVFGIETLSKDRGHLFGRWLDLGHQGHNLTVYGDGSQVIDPVPVENIGEACFAWLNTPFQEKYTVVNITSNGPLTLRRLAELFVESEHAPGIDFLPATAADTARGWGDASAYEELTGSKLRGSAETLVSTFLHDLNT